MAKRNYYEVLGITKDASADEIRKAYRGLARTYHPDVNKSPDAAKKFAEVQAAYEVLSDETKRKRFDQYGDVPESGPGPSGAPGGTYTWSNAGGPGGFRVDGFDPDELSSIFEAVMGGGGASDSPFQGRGHKGPGKSASGRRGRAKPIPEPITHTIRVPFERMASGGTESLTLSQDGARRTIEVRIPRAIEDGAQLRMRGAVQSSGADLILTVNVIPHPLLSRGEGAQAGKGLDLFLTLPLTIAEATLGATVTVPGVRGKVEMSIPPKSDSGSRLRLKGLGLEDDAGRKGDIYLTVAIVTPDPTKLSSDQISALQAAGTATTAPRTGFGWL